MLRLAIDAAVAITHTFETQTRTNNSNTGSLQFTVTAKQPRYFHGTMSHAK